MTYLPSTKFTFFIVVTSAQSFSEKKGRANIKIILPVVFLGVLLIGLSSTWFWYKWRKRHHPQPTREGKKIIVYAIRE